MPSKRCVAVAGLVFSVMAVAAHAQTPENSSATAASTSMAAEAPIPAALLTAKKVFISNAGADSGLFPHPFSGTPARGYNQLYSGLQAWGKYAVVADPQDADLVFEIRLIAPYGPTNANKVAGASDPLPMFRLVIFDQKTHYTLWALTESINPAFSQKTHDRNLDDALAALITDLRNLTAKS